MAVDFKDERIAGLTLNSDLRRCTRRSAWPSLRRFDAWLLAGRRSRKVDFAWRSAAKRVMWTVLVLPFDDEVNLALEFRLILGHDDQPQDLLKRSVKAFDDRNATVLADRTETGQDVHGLAPDVLEVLALELPIDNQMFGSDSLAEHDSHHCCGHVL
jgi:hypothetical protein